MIWPVSILLTGQMLLYRSDGDCDFPGIGTGCDE